VTDIRSVGFRPASAQKWYSEVCLGRRRDKALQTRGLTFFLRVGFDGTRRDLDMGGCLHVTVRWNSSGPRPVQPQAPIFAAGEVRTRYGR
jgi:hypothetical protein